MSATANPEANPPLLDQAELYARVTNWHENGVALPRQSPLIPRSLISLLQSTISS